MEVVEGEDEDGHADSEVNELAISASGTLGSSRGRFYFAEMTTIDPELWRQETERVTPLLRKYEGTMNNVGGLSATWRTHLDLLVNHVREVIQGETTNKTKKESVPRLTSSAIAESISSLRSNLQETLSKIQHSEKLLTGRATFTGFALEYEGYQKVRRDTMCIRMRQGSEVTNIAPYPVHRACCSCKRSVRSSTLKYRRIMRPWQKLKKI